MLMKWNWYNVYFLIIYNLIKHLILKIMKESQRRKGGEGWWWGRQNSPCITRQKIVALLYKNLIFCWFAAVSVFMRESGEEKRSRRSRRSPPPSPLLSPPPSLLVCSSHTQVSTCRIKLTGWIHFLCKTFKWNIDQRIFMPQSEPWFTIRSETHIQPRPAQNTSLSSYCVFCLFCPFILSSLVSCAANVSLSCFQSPKQILYRCGTK